MKKALAFLVGARNAAALLADPGMGKTSITYAAILVLIKKQLAKGALVSAPRRPARSVWPAEQKKWLDFAGLSVGVLHGKDKETVLYEDHDIYVVTYEGWEWLFGPPAPNFAAIKDKEERDRARKEYKELMIPHRRRTERLFERVDIKIFDELSKMKHMKTSRHKIIEPHLPRFSRRWGLTGSFAANGMENVFGQVYSLDLGRSLGPYITHFRRQFFDAIPRHPKDKFPPLVLKPGAEKRIYSQLKDLAFRLDADDYLTLPKVIPVPMRFDLPDEHQAYYDQMYEEMRLYIESSDELFTAKAASSVSMKCRQITSGAIYHDKIDPITGEPKAGPRKWTELHDEKMQMCLDLIEELQGAQLLIAYEFRHEAERLGKLLGKDMPYIGPGVNDKKALSLEKRWNSGELPYLVAHPASIGHGLNLQGSSARHILWLSGTWDFELYDQFIRRLKRQGSEARSIMVYWLIARDTVDELVYNDKFRKARTQTSLYNAFKK